MNAYDVAIERYIQGESIKTLAKDLQISPASLSDKIKLKGIVIRGKTTTAKDWLQYSKVVVELHGKGLSVRKIHDVTKIPRNKISYILKANGKSIKDRGQKYDYNENAFDSIDNEEKAYWLGFMYADGYLGRGKGYEIKLSLQKSDESHLRKFADFIGDNLPIHDDSDNPNAKRVIAGNKKLYMALSKLGCMNAKTFNIKFPDYNIVPKHLIHHFIRGYFDGDGGISFDKDERYKKPILVIYITATQEFLAGCQQIFGTKNKPQDASYCGQVGTFRCRGNKKPMRILDYLYEDATIFLERKHTLYQSYKAGLMPSDGESRQIIRAE